MPRTREQQHISVTVRCVKCKATREVLPGGDPDDVPWCETCQRPMVAVKATAR
jgi:hypothetical protein